MQFSFSSWVRDKFNDSKSTPGILMRNEDPEEAMLRSVALQNVSSILQARERAEAELVQAKVALEQKTAELAHSLSLMQATIEATTDGILVVDNEGKVTCWNTNFLHMWRLPTDLVESREDARLLERAVIQLADPDEYLTRTQVIYDSSLPDSYDIVEFADGRIFERFSKLQLLNGKAVGRVWSFRDVTDKRAADAALRISEQYNRSIIESSPDCIKTLNLVGEVVWISERGLRILNLDSSTEVLGRSWISFWAEKDQPRARKAVEDASAGRTGKFSGDFEKGETLSSWDVVITPIADSDGLPYQLLAVSRDVTEQRKILQALRESEALLRKVTNESRVGLVMVGSDRRYLFANTTYGEIHNLAGVDIVGQRVEDVLGELYEQVQPRLDKAFGGERVEYELKVPAHHAGDAPRFYEVVYDPRTSEGQISVLVVLVDVTRRKQAEEALRRSEQELRALADSIPQLAWIADPEGSIFWYNRGWYEYTGTTLEEMQGWGWQSVHDPEVLPRVVEQWKKSISTGSPFEMEFPLLGADGVFRWFLTRVNPVRNSEGKVVRWFGTNTDVDQVKKVREALKEETRILELLNNTGTAIASQLDLETLVQTVTDAGTELSGARFGAFFYNVINAEGESFLLYTLSGAPREAFEKFGLPRNTPIFNPTFTGAGVVRSDDITRDPRYGTLPPHHGMPRGHLPVCSYLAAPVVSRSGEVLGGLFFGHPDPGVFSERAERLIVGIASQAAIAIDNARLYDAAQRELTQRQMAEQALRESGERLRAAMAAAGTSTFRWNIAEGTVEADEALYSLFGLHEKRVVEAVEVLMECIYTEDRYRVAQAVAECVSNASDLDVEFRVVWPDGSLHWVADKARMYLDESNKPSHMIGACIDITAQKAVNAELQKTRDAALEANRAKSTFLANMSHELRTPLNAIIGYAEMIEEEVHGLDGQVKQDVARIQHAGRHLLSLISDILDLSKIEAGKMELYVSTFDVTQMVSGVVSTLYPIFLKSQNQIVINVPQGTGSITTDGTKLKQILFNLLSNAVKFTEKGEISVTVERQVVSGRDVIIFHVVDTGIGMTPEEMKLLFGEFSQIDSSSTRRHGGSGLGLAISKRFSNMLGGDITVESEKHKGSRFTVTIPAFLEELPLSQA